MIKAMHRLLIALLATTLLVTACGGDDDDVAASGDAGTTETTEAPEPDTDEPSAGGEVECLPAAEVGDIVGFTMGEPDPSDVPTLYLQCLYTAEDGIHGVQTLEYYATGDVESSYDIFLDVADDEVTVAGVGDKAGWSPGVTKLFVVQGDVAAQVSVSYFDPPEYDPQALAIAVAEAMLAA